MITPLRARRPCCGIAVRLREGRDGQVLLFRCQCHPEGRAATITVNGEDLLELTWEPTDDGSD